MSKQNLWSNSQEQKYGTFNPFTMETNARSQNVTLKVCIDVILLSIFASFLALFYHYLTPYRRGFFCDDESILYPKRQETISDQKLWCISVLVPVALIVLTEAYRYYRKTDVTQDNDIYFLGWKVPFMYQRVYVYTGIFLFGIIMAELVANYMKILIGRFRPSFLVMCKPDFNCSNAEYPHFYVENFSCTNKDLDDEEDLRKSFPSGHSSVSTFAMLYVALYLQKRLEITTSFLVKPFIQLLLLMLAVFICFSRIRDYKHHWDDVAAGFILGFTICLVMIFTQTDLFKKQTQNNIEITKGSQT
ncbi:putative phosphatidate phosphatase isoform X2 [Parasteatoda tepidariorum]|uniref:putative phosphatidate phosphatase isoform X2 n=1 Tax=Parasteatoda tepidariorum TaxID=114398 RepID=UPI001C724229|nr:putative phosphatidate phosphatase isoform X2 [Parasteatoda tepidariorum]